MRDTTCSVPDVVSRGRKCVALCNRVREAADRAVLARHIEDRIQSFRVERALEDLPETERNLLQRLYGCANPAPWYQIAKELHLQVERVGPTRVRSFVARGEIVPNRRSTERCEVASRSGRSRSSS